MMRKMLVNNFGLTIITTMEEEHLMAKYTFDKISLAISGFYELDHEESLLLLLQHKVPGSLFFSPFFLKPKFGISVSIGIQMCFLLNRVSFFSKQPYIGLKSALRGT